MAWAPALAFGLCLVGVLVGLRFSFRDDPGLHRRIGAFLVLALVGLALATGGA